MGTMSKVHAMMSLALIGLGSAMQQQHVQGINHQNTHNTNNPNNIGVFNQLTDPTEGNLRDYVNEPCSECLRQNAAAPPLGNSMCICVNDKWMLCMTHRARIA